MNKSRQNILLIYNTIEEAGELYESLECSGYRVIAMTTKDKAIEAAIQYQPDLIIVSLSPDSLATCKYLNTNTYTKNIPTVASGDKEGSNSALIAFNLGCIGYIKPMEHNLASKLTRYVKLFDLRKGCRELCEKFYKGV